MCCLALGFVRCIHMFYSFAHAPLHFATKRRSATHTFVTCKPKRRHQPKALLQQTTTCQQLLPRFYIARFATHCFAQLCSCPAASHLAAAHVRALTRRVTAAMPPQQFIVKYATRPALRSFDMTRLCEKSQTPSQRDAQMRAVKPSCVRRTSAPIALGCVSGKRWRACSPTSAAQ